MVWTKDSEQFLIKRLTEEWESARRAEKRHEVARQVVDTGKKVGKALLCLALVGGAITIAAVAPNIFSAFGRISHHRRFFKKKEVQRSLYTFTQRSIFTVEKTNHNHYRIFLTAKGRRRALREALERFHLQKAGQWDGIWRMVLFDIPRAHNKMRDILRYRLRMIGMEQLQESVFIFPYSCEEEVRFVVSLCNASRYVRYLQTNEIKGVIFSKGEVHIT